MHRPFATAVVDEADSILIDEARIPLVIAGGADDAPGPAARRRPVVREPAHAAFTSRWSAPAGTSRSRRQASSTWSGPRIAGISSRAATSPLLTAVQDALHAHVLLRRDVDYVVQDEAVVSVDEFKGRIVHERRWPAGLQTALEVKEGVAPQAAGPGARIDHDSEPDRALSRRLRHDGHGRDAGRGVPGDLRARGRDHPHESSGRADRRAGRRVSDQGRKGSGRRRRDLAASTRRGARCWSARRAWRNPSGSAACLATVPHHVLNARNEEAEAAIIARAGDARRRHDLHQHGRPRRRHPAGAGSGGAGRPARHRHEPAREPADRQPAARPRRPAGRSGQLAVLRLVSGSADGEVRRRRSRSRTRPTASSGPRKGRTSTSGFS